jgi:hypothetical protein
LYTEVVGQRSNNTKTYKDTIESKLKVIQGQQNNLQKFNVKEFYSNYKSKILDARKLVYENELKVKLEQEKQD